MDLSIPHEYEMIRETARAFVRRHLAPLEASVDEADDVDPEVMRRLRFEAVKLGLFAYNMPAELGGPGLSLLGQSMIDQEMGRTSKPLSEAFGSLPGTLKFCNADQREWLVSKLIRGETTIAYALTEPDAGSDLSNLKTRAVKTDGGWRINGSKHFISGAERADHILVLAVTNPEADLKRKLTTFIVDRHNPGLTVTRRFRKMGWRGYHLSALSFDDCLVPDKNILGEAGGGFSAMMATINTGRLSVAGKCVGMADALRDLAISYSRERITFGSRLADHQAIQFAIADLDIELEAARMLIYRAIDFGERDNSEFRIAASRAKVFASEMTCRAADRVMQIFGGAGYMCDLPVERFYRDARAYRIGEGTSEMQRIQIARHLLG